MSRNCYAGGKHSLLGSSIDQKGNMKGFLFLFFFFFWENLWANRWLSLPWRITLEKKKRGAVLHFMPIYTASAITESIWVGDKIGTLLCAVERSKGATLSGLEYEKPFIISKMGHRSRPRQERKEWQ